MGKMIIRSILSIVFITFLSIHFSVQVHAGERLSGVTRYETAVAVSKEWQNADTIVLARGDAFADALTGTALAYQENAPILLTEKNRLTDVTKQEIIRLGANRVIILGGEGAISKAVSDELNNMGLSVSRIGGKDRYETSTLIAERLVYDYDFPIDWMILASGQNYADALSVAQVSSIDKHPILLTASNNLSTATRDFIEEQSNISTIYMIGGNAAISNTVEQELKVMKNWSGTPEHDVIRISGQDRYETLQKIVHAFPEIITDIPSQNNGTSHSAIFVSGDNFPDALTASALASMKNKLILMVKPNQVPTSVKQLVNDFTITDYQIVGGKSAIHAETENEIDNQMKNPSRNSKKYTYLTLDNIVEITQKMINGESVIIDGAPFTLGGSLTTNQQFLSLASWNYVSRWEGARIYDYPFGLTTFSDNHQTYNDYIGFSGEDRTDGFTAYEAMNILKAELGIHFEWNGSVFSGWYYQKEDGFTMYINTMRGPDVISITYSKR